MPDEASALTYALSKQLSSARTLETSFGALDLDEELRIAVDAAVRPILKRRLNSLAAALIPQSSFTPPL
ncbi:hypothetical protein [Achromobacter aloeverae]